jgi:hypothetical protein
VVAELPVGEPKHAVAEGLKPRVARAVGLDALQLAAREIGVRIEGGGDVEAQVEGARRVAFWSCSAVRMPRRSRRVRAGCVRGMPRRRVVSLEVSRTDRWMTMPRRPLRPPEPGTVTSMGPGLGGSMPPEGAGGSVARNRALATRQNSRHAPALEGKAGVPDRIDPAMDAMESADSDAVRDRV